jgi:hypothetical protein
LFPLLLSAVVCLVWDNIIFQIVVCVVGFLWATFGPLLSRSSFSLSFPALRKSSTCYDHYLVLISDPSQLR